MQKSRLAQSVEHETLNLGVVGFEPHVGLNFFFFFGGGGGGVDFGFCFCLMCVYSMERSKTTFHFGRSRGNL